MQFGDVIKSVLKELLPNRLCDYLSSICVKFTDFVTKCRVLASSQVMVDDDINTRDNAIRMMKSRLVLCESTKSIMSICFELLGIEPLDRI
jgi:arginyl-tRNA synthetase